MTHILAPILTHIAYSQGHGMLELSFYFIVVQISAAPDREGEQQGGDAAVYRQLERPRGDREAAGGGESFGGQGFSI